SDANGVFDTFVRDLQARSTVLASVNRAGTGAVSGRSYVPAFSDDGRFVVFASDAADVVDNDSNGAVLDVFRRDLVARKTVLVSVNAAGDGSGNGASGAVPSKIS